METERAENKTANQSKPWSTGRKVVAILFLLGTLLLIAMIDSETAQQYDAQISGRTGVFIMTDETTGERLPIAIVSWNAKIPSTIEEGSEANYMISPLEGMDSIKVNETLPKSQVIEYRNAFGKLKRTELILGRDVEIVQKR